MADSKDKHIEKTSVYYQLGTLEENLLKGMKENLHFEYHTLVND